MSISPFQKKALLVSSIILVVLVLFVWLVCLPLVNKIRAASSEYLFNQEILKKLDQRESLFKELEEYYQEKESDLELIEGVFLDQDEAVGYISTLETIAEQTGNGFEIKTASVFGSAEGEEYFLALRISLWGSFSNLLEFIANLEDSPYPPYRLIEISNLTINRIELGRIIMSESGPKTGDLETQLVIKIYTQKP